MSDYFKVTEEEQHTAMQVLRPCEIRWTENGLTWHSCGDAIPNELHVISCDYRRPRRRCWEARVDGRRVQFYIPPKETTNP